MSKFNTCMLKFIIISFSSNEHCFSPKGTNGEMNKYNTPFLLLCKQFVQIFQ
jgi:hypothetical protein